jgi:hypothetical protein
MNEMFVAVRDEGALDKCQVLDILQSIISSTVVHKFLTKAKKQ